MIKALKLKAVDANDLRIISAYLQDAVTVAGDLAYLKKQHRFAGMFNRYCWEAQDIEHLDLPEGMTCLRVRSGLHFDGILKVESQNILQLLKSAPLELLAIDCEEEEDGAALITFLFAGGGTIRLHGECIEAYLSDVSEPWPARCEPAHEALSQK
jgi:hypothetical protein